MSKVYINTSSSLCELLCIVSYLNSLQNKSRFKSHVAILFLLLFGGVILGSPSLRSTISLKTMTGHHSVFVQVFSQWNDEVLRAPPALLSLWTSRQSDDSAVGDVRVPKVAPKEVSLWLGHGEVPFHRGVLRNAIRCALTADMSV